MKEVILIVGGYEDDDSAQGRVAEYSFNRCKVPWAGSLKYLQTASEQYAQSELTHAIRRLVLCKGSAWPLATRPDIVAGIMVRGETKPTTGRNLMSKLVPKSKARQSNKIQ